MRWYVIPFKFIKNTSSNVFLKTLNLRVMQTSIKIIILSFFIFVPEQVETCDMESFNVTCAVNEVIVILSAQYGRMQPGRCIEGTYRIGCEENVMSFMDKRCSGERSCLVSMPDPTIHRSRPCPKDLVSYLLTTYQCAKGKV